MFTCLLLNALCDSIGFGIVCNAMFSSRLTYAPGTTPVHRCDARIKILALAAFSVGIFFVNSWWGMAAFATVILAVTLIARIPLSQMSRLLVPIYVLGAFSVLFNVLVSPNVEGLLTGLFFMVRMVVLIAASFVVCLTTPSSKLLEAFRWLIGPLRAIRVPVDDIALTLALSLRFIPVIEREFVQIRAAQVSRGAESAKSFKRTLEIWAGAFSALFVGLFRHADALATAMDARCYGASETRSRLPKA